MKKLYILALIAGSLTAAALNAEEFSIHPVRERASTAAVSREQMSIKPIQDRASTQVMPTADSRWNDLNQAIKNKDDAQTEQLINQLDSKVVTEKDQFERANTIARDTGNFSAYNLLQKKYAEFTSK